MESLKASHYSKREIFFFKNTLLCLVKSLEKRCTTIDLRNETYVTGKIEEVDGYMNVVLSDAAFYDSDGKYQYFPMLHVQARNIRNVHIPDNVSIMKAIKNQVSVEPKKTEKKKLTFKQSRAKKQQEETLKLIKQMKEEKLASENKKVTE